MSRAVDRAASSTTIPPPPVVVRPAGRYLLKTENLDSVVAAFQEAGARCVVVSGVVDPVGGVHPDKVPHAALTVCRLRADEEVLGQRLVARRGDDGMAAEALAEAAAMDAGGIGDVCVDITGLSVSEVVRRVKHEVAEWPGLVDLLPSDRAAACPPIVHSVIGDPADTASGSILWLCGATGVGKSSVGFSVYAKTTFGEEIPRAYLDLDQIGFLSPAPPDDPGNHRVKARILGALWKTFRAAGAQTLIVVGPAEDDAAIKIYSRELPSPDSTVCRLHAGPDQLTRQILRGRQGGSWAQPGDPLKGRTEPHLRAVAEQAAERARALETAGVGDIRIDTDGLTTEQVTEVVLAEVAYCLAPRHPL